MINIDILIRCEKCKEIVTISNIYVDNKTSEEEHLIKEYKCLSCNYINIKKEYINYILDKSIFKQK